MAASILTIKINTNTTGILGFLSLICIGLFILLGMTYLFDKYLNYRIRLLVRENINSFKMR
jgi:hypothetical protein